MIRTIGTVVVTAILVSAFWIFYFNILGGSGGSNSRGQSGGGGPGEVLAEGVTVGPSGLAIPVVGVKASDLLDTFTQGRAGGARVHDAIDIMAPTGRPVVAAAPGKVEKIFFSPGGGGNTVYVRSDDGRWIYYYAHLSAYAPGLREGQRVQRGTPLGLVGATGNANPAGPHLHFAIHRMAPGQKWYEGSAVNPYPLLAGKRVSG